MNTAQRSRLLRNTRESRAAFSNHLTAEGIEYSGHCLTMQGVVESSYSVLVANVVLRLLDEHSEKDLAELKAEVDQS